MRIFSWRSWRDQELIDAFMKEHVSLVKEIAEKDVEINELRDAARIVREAIDRYCPPNLRGSAEEWLRQKGI